MTTLKKMRLLQKKRDEMDAKRVMDKTRKYLAQVGSPPCTTLLLQHFQYTCSAAAAAAG